MTNAPATLEELLLPLGEAEFSGVMRERKLMLRRGAGRDRYQALLAWPSLRAMIERGEHPSFEDFRIGRESVFIPPDRWSNRGRVEMAKLDDYVERGYSVIMTEVQRHIAPLGSLCEDIKTRLGEASYAGIIVANGSSAVGALKIHYDPEDLLVMQIEGTKRWRVFGPAVPHPVRGMLKPPPPAQTEPLLDEVLEAGDILYVPGGNWHHCENGPGRSTHLGIFFIPPTGWHAVRSLVTKLMSDELFRMPLTRVDDEADQAALEADIKNRVVEKINAMTLNDFLSEWHKKPIY